MRIAQVAPLHESVPPKFYGGTERVVHYLTEELVRAGHDVTLYASGDSRTSARLRSVCDSALRLGRPKPNDPMAHHYLLAELIAQECGDYDVVHFHIDYFAFSVIRQCKMAAISTLHGRLDIPDLYPLFREFDDMRLVSISDAQRAPMEWANWEATVYHGLPEDLHAPRLEGGEYLAFLGRISPEKRVDLAIEIARQAGMKIRIAAKIDPSDQDYYESVRHLFDEPHVEFLGEIGEENKGEFLGNAAALLFPVDWPEPFGLVMIEALACGTPVIAFRRGSVPEIIEHGLTGFVVDNVEEAARAARRISLIKREICRSEFENRFSARRMCHDYLRVYRGVLAENRRRGVNSGDLSLVA
ncbi:MAG TPA: glycosyltransferase family 4 protein [Acidobacteriaceae bacterium]|nr:glycosyltransferase family 4 protein [Acidobacteriaceae bacterium]